MKTKLRYILIFLVTLSFQLFASPFDDAVFRVTFDDDSVDDITTGNVSTGTASNVTFTEVPLMANANGRGAVFNGSTSKIEYGLGDGDELKLRGLTGLTYHARVKFNNVINGQFIMGRFGDPTASPTSVRVSWLELCDTSSARGGVSWTGTFIRGNATAANTIKAGIFYDVFMRFRPRVGAVNGSVETVVYNAETGDFVAKSVPYSIPTGYLLDSSLIKFTLGWRNIPGSNFYLDGVIEQVNVWDRELTETELTEISWSSPFEDVVFRATFGGDSVDDITGDNVSAGTASNITFTDVPLMANGNGRAAVFDGSTSKIEYGLGSGNELKISGLDGITYHARVKFGTVEYEQFIMGRFGDPAASPTSLRVSWLELCDWRNVRGGVSWTGTYLRGHPTANNSIKAGVFYDIFMRCRPKIGTADGCIETIVFNAETGEFLTEARYYIVLGTYLCDTDLVKFTVGWRNLPGSNFYFDGLIEQINVWDRCLTGREMVHISRHTLVFDDAIFRVNFGGDSVDDITIADVSTGTASNVTFTDVPLMANGNGRGAVFNGSTSKIEYVLGDGNELKLNGFNGLTYHARVKFNSVANEQFIMGRFGDPAASPTSLRVSWLELCDLSNVRGGISWTGTHLRGNPTATNSIETGIFYDIFMRCRPKVGTVDGSVETVVYNAETGAFVAKSTPYAVLGTYLCDTDVIKFTVGWRNLSGYNYPLDGVIEQINVWGRELTEDEMLQIPQICNGVSKFSKSASERWHEWRKNCDTFPIAAWGALLPYVGTVSEFTTYENANLTITQSKLNQVSNLASVGLKSYIGLSDETGLEYANLHLNPERLADYVDYANDNSSVDGYCITDEPRRYNVFWSAGKCLDYIYSHDSKDNLPVVDLFPYVSTPAGLAYNLPTFYEYEKDYLQSFIDMAHPSVLLDCCYTINQDGTTDKERFYSNAEIYRRNALEADIGYMGFLLNTRHFGYREPSESDVYWQVYSIIAYGGKGVWYYNYRHNVSGWYSGLVNHLNDAPHTTYYYAQSVNSEILNIGSVLMDLESIGVYHTSDVPSESKLYSNGSVTGMTYFSGSDFLIGEFENMDDELDDDIYVMVVNKRQGMGKNVNDSSLLATAQFKVNSSYPYVYKYDKSDGSLDILTPSNDTYTLSNMGGGQGYLLRFSSDAE